MTDLAPSVGWRLRVLAARVQRAIGIAGLLGLAALVAGLLLGWNAWAQHQRFMEEVASRPAEVSPSRGATDALTPETVRIRWPSPDDVPVLLARMERAAVQEGLGWPQADYRMLPSSGEMPASLEVRCTLKGPYPAIRRFVTAMLLDQPTLTLREFGISRANSEAGNVDAKLTLVVYLGDPGSEGRP